MRRTILYLSLFVSLMATAQMLSTKVDTVADSAYTWPVNTFERDSNFQLNRGVVMHLWYHDTIPVCIYCPPDYWNDNFYKKPFNILYLLSGTKDDDDAWIKEGGASNILDEMYQDHEIEPMVVVMPKVSPEMDGKFELDFYEFMHVVESHLYAGLCKERRAIAGLSIGAFHSMHISHYYPNMFNYVGIFSGIYTPDKSKIFKRDVSMLFPSDSTVAEPYRHVDADMARQFQNPPRLYYIAVGSGDFLYNQNRLMQRYMKEHGYEFRYHESDGKHEWKNWSDYLTLFLPKLFRNIETEEDKAK